jgi:pyruvate,orthophosphate dikinase
MLPTPPDPTVANEGNGVKPPPLVLLDHSRQWGRAVLGGKAAGIVAMRQLGLPVPPAFALTTMVCSRFQEFGPKIVNELWPDICSAMAQLEADTGRTFGRGDKPLLISVRSGAPVSMPGMMDTILNLGMTDEVQAALAAFGGDGYAARSRTAFDEQFAGIVGQPPPTDPWEQLRAAIIAVFQSWRSERAVAYRRSKGLRDEGGTAVTVQAMVFGNLNDRSGTGVLFTRNPATGSGEPYGEWLPNGQGEDVVSGKFTPRPLTMLQEDLPEVHAQLLGYAAQLEELTHDVQDIEFTIEDGKLWLLQTRSAKRSPFAAVRIAVGMKEAGRVDEAGALTLVTSAQVRQVLKPQLDPDEIAAAELVASGLPASPGFSVGVVYNDPDEAEAAAAQGISVILCRRTTSPDDVHGMIASSALVTELGGRTSHAAVVSRDLGLPCVVGCGKDSLINLTGQTITVDGGTGRVYAGARELRTRSESTDPDLALLLEWARDRAPLRAWTPEQAPAHAVSGEHLTSIAAIRAALSDGTTDVVVDHPLPVLLDALRVAPGSAAEEVESGPAGERNPGSVDEKARA